MSADRRTYRQAARMVRAAGMAIKDGLGFTWAGGHLVNGDEAPPHIKNMNGWAVEDIADALAESAKEKA